MTENTRISWATHTFNPWVGCTKVSPGCDNCYAETLTKRMGKDVWGVGKERSHTTDAYWRKALKWDAEAKATGIRPRVFPSMCDPFDAEAPDEWRRQLFTLIECTPHLDWLLLTKRPNLILKRIPLQWRAIPPANVWYGTSIENQAHMWRADALREVPARLRFLSLEPLLGPLTDLRLDGIDWAITGGESGGHRRPMELAWAEDIRRQCEAAGVAFWFKQVSAFKPGQGEDALGAVYQELPRCPG